MKLIVFAHAKNTTSSRKAAKDEKSGKPNPVSQRNKGARGVVGGFLQRFRNRVSSLTKRNQGARNK